MFKKILNLINRYLQLDLYYYIKNSFYLISSRLGIELARFALSIAFARLVTKEMYGQWNFILSVVGVCAILTLPGIVSAITQSVSTGHDGVLVRGTKQRFKWGIWGTFIAMGAGLYYVFSGEPAIGTSLIIASFLFPIYNGFHTFAAFFAGKKRFDKVAKYQLITQATPMLITIGVIYFSRNLILIVTVYLLSLSVLRGYFFRIAHQKMENRNDDPEAVPYGRHLTVTLIPSEIRQNYDRIIIALLISFQELAIYTIALGFTDVIYSLSSIIATLILPKLSQMDQKAAYLEVKKRWPWLVLGFGIICGVAIALCPYIIPFFYTAKYADSVFYAQLLLISVIIAAPIPIINKALFLSQKRVSELYRLRIYSAIIEIILLTVLALKFGLLGIVIAVILGRTLTTLYSFKLAGFLSFRSKP
jgi:O-antigen/teichoic acid export membrane protein